MKQILLLYTEQGGNLEHIAKLIYREFNAHNILAKNLKAFDVAEIKDFDFYIFGSADSGSVDPNWEAFFESIKHKNFANKKFALFALGDQLWYPEKFVDVLGYLNQKVTELGGIVVGKWPTKDYHFQHSQGSNGQHFYGLVLDANSQDDMTPGRVKAWTSGLREQFGIQ